MGLRSRAPEGQRPAPSHRTRLENRVPGKLCSHEGPETPLGPELALRGLSFQVCEVKELEVSVHFL